MSRATVMAGDCFVERVAREWAQVTSSTAQQRRSTAIKAYGISSYSWKAWEPLRCISLKQMLLKDASVAAKIGEM